jgi:hypothetical protein
VVIAGTPLQEGEPRAILDHIVSTITVDIIVVSDTTTAFFIPLVALLTSSPVMWDGEHFWNFTVLQRIHLSNFIYNREVRHTFCRRLIDF